jgi:hypothetical protein
VTRLEEIIAHGNRSRHSPEELLQWRANIIKCADGFTFSAIAGAAASCTPQPAFCVSGTCPEMPTSVGDVACTYPGSFSTIEVGFPSSRPEPWDEWEKYGNEGDVFSYVPVDLVRELVASHGGEQ